jgi:signal transduction histidine kinase
VRKGEGRRAWHDVNDLVRGAIAFIEPEIADSGIDLVTEEMAGLPAVQVDPIQIEQVVLNLVRNAVDALHVARNGGNPFIRVVTRLCAPGTVEISVADNGPGITAHDADFIFDEFYTTKSDGLGLGLSISRSIIEAHGGRLWMDASHVQGSKFRFTLPAAS